MYVNRARAKTAKLAFPPLTTEGQEFFTLSSQENSQWQTPQTFAQKGYSTLPIPMLRGNYRVSTAAGKSSMASTSMSTLFPCPPIPTQNPKLKLLKSANRISGTQLPIRYSSEHSTSLARSRLLSKAGTRTVLTSENDKSDNKVLKTTITIPILPQKSKQSKKVVKPVPKHISTNPKLKPKVLTAEITTDALVISTSDGDPKLSPLVGARLNENSKEKQNRIDDRFRVNRTEKEREANPDCVRLDSLGMKQFPLVGSEESQLRVFSLQHNLITRLDNIPALIHLLVLDLYDNRVERITGLHGLPSLKVLLLGKNRIRRIEGLDNLKRLEILDLHGNQLRYVDNLASLSSLRVLNLAGNMIRTIRNLGPYGLSSLMELNLKRNRIKSLEGLQKAPHIKKLYLANNDLQSVSSLQPLKKLIFLQEILLESNPLSSIPDYTSQILTIFPFLETLDKVTISEQMRSDAKAWHKRRLVAEEEKRKELEKIHATMASSRDEVIFEAKRRWESLKYFVRNNSAEPEEPSASIVSKFPKTPRSKPTTSQVTVEPDNEEIISRDSPQLQPDNNRLPAEIPGNDCSSDIVNSCIQTESVDDIVPSDIIDNALVILKPESLLDTFLVEDEDSAIETLGFVAKSNRPGSSEVSDNSDCVVTNDIIDDTNLITISTSMMTSRADTSSENTDKFGGVLNVTVDTNSEDVDYGKSSPNDSHKNTRQLPTIPRPISKSTKVAVVRPLLRPSKTTESQIANPVLSNTSVNFRRSIPITSDVSGPNINQENSKYSVKAEDTAPVKAVQFGENIIHDETTNESASTEDLDTPPAPVTSSIDLPEANGVDENVEGNQESVNESNEGRRSGTPNPTLRRTKSEFHLPDIFDEMKDEKNSEHLDLVPSKFSSRPSLGNLRSSSIDVFHSDSDTSDIESVATSTNTSDISSRRPVRRQTSKAKWRVKTARQSSITNIFNRRPATCQKDRGQGSTFSKPLKRSDSGQNLEALSPPVLKRQGADYLVEIDGKVLNIYGQGALKHTLHGFSPSITIGVSAVNFHFISYDMIIPYFGKLKQCYPSLEIFHFRSNNICTLGQLNALSDLQGIVSLHISEDGNPVVENPFWKEYAIYRLGHWGLQYVNGKEVVSEYRNGRSNAESDYKMFESLGYLALSCLPQTALKPLAKRLHTLHCFCCCSPSSSSDESGKKKMDSNIESNGNICNSWDDDPVLLDVIGKEALVYNQPDQNRTKESHEVATKIINSGQAMLEKLELLDKVWPSMMCEAIQDILTDYMFMDNYMKKGLKMLNDEVLANEKLK